MDWLYNIWGGGRKIKDEVNLRYFTCHWKKRFTSKGETES